jgi:hypothetical protein
METESPRLREGFLVVSVTESDRIAPSRSRGRRCGWRLYFVGLAEADANEPIDHQGEWQEGEYGQEDGTAQESRKDLLLAEEEGACSEEEPEAHAP